MSISSRDIEKGRFIEASRFIKESLCTIFNDRKFENLVRFRVAQRGPIPSDSPYLIRLSRSEYYSEKRFSTGEIALLRLIERLEKASNNSLVLLDEAELALHPEIQRRLLSFLEGQSRDKQLIVLIATHSNTLLVNAKPQRIILLRKTNDSIESVNPCYPAEAMRSIDLFDSVLGDYLVLVEDDVAQKCFQSMCRRAVREEHFGREALSPILPVGTFYDTATFAINISFKVPEYTSVKALLDHDAFTDERIIALKERYGGIVHDLGFTPEEELLELMEKTPQNLRNTAKQSFK